MTLKKKRGHEYAFTRNDCPFHDSIPKFLGRGVMIECVGCGTVLRDVEFYIKRGTDGRRRKIFADESPERGWQK